MKDPAAALQGILGEADALLRPLGSRLQHERNRIENAHLKDRFVMRDEASNVVRVGPEP
jgi:hypothetical protein